MAAGSRHEEKPEQGVYPILSSICCLKGTSRRSARAISEEMDRLGGSVNAYTAKGYTPGITPSAFRKRRAGDGHPLRYADLSPAGRGRTWKRERGVILDEMAMYEDSGEDVAHEALCAAVWPDSPLGRTICGLPGTVSALAPDDLAAVSFRPLHAGTDDRGGGGRL